MYDDYYYDDERGRTRWKALALGAGAVTLAAVGWFVVKPRLGDDGTALGPGPGTGTSVAVAVDSTVEAATTVIVTTEAPATTDEDVTATSTTVARTVATTTVVPRPTTTAPTTTTRPEPPPTTTTTTTTTAPTPPLVAAYPTLPDGSPVPIVAIFDANSITLRGVVPDAKARETLENLARVSAKPGQADTVNNEVTINPAVPRNIGVRVVELTSTRFAEGSSTVVPAHAAELKRVADVMGALTHVTALIIGHADQRGDDAANLALSEARAASVKNYITSQGIDPARLSSRGVGEQDLITLADDDAALALNRRTEFVLYGLLI